MNNTKHNKIIKYGSIFFSIVILILIIWFLKRNESVFLNLKNLQISDILLISLIQPITIAITALINFLIIEEMGYPIAYKDNLLLQFVNNLLNNLISEGGAVYRGAYLKTMYSFSISNFFASIGGAYIITLLVNSIIGLLFSSIIYLNTKVINVYLVLLFLFTMIATLFLIIFTPKFNRNGWLYDRLNQILQGWNKIKGKPKLILTIIGLTLSISLLQSVTIFIAYRGLNTNIGFVNTIYYSSLSSLANFVNITPGGLGITEGFLVFSYRVIDLPIAVILLGALLIRSINLIISIILGYISYLFLQIKLHKNLKSN